MLHDRLFKKLQEKNLPQPELPKECKYYFREVAVGWKVLKIDFNLKRDWSELKVVLNGLDNEKKDILRKQVELNLIDRVMYDKMIKWILTNRYPIIKLNLLKFVDYICIVGNNTAWIIEGKEKLNYEAIGQVGVYSCLFSKDYPQFTVKKAILCEESDPLLESCCKEFGIAVFVL
ncbi:hypothetical protein DRP05_13270 [Archaeoglobales archaeon]|nr:MAG: hypothetical protein DRP05_13270 [Archaeoglobales archaeon]